MSLDELIKEAHAAAADPNAPLPDPKTYGEHAALVSLVSDLIQENRRLKEGHQEAIAYIRKKIDQLLVIIGTVPLRAEELNDHTLLQLDPIGVVAETFSQILEHLRSTNEQLIRTRKEMQAIFESVGGGILVLGNDLRIQSFNKRFREMFLPATDTDPIGRYCRDIVCRESRPPDNCSFQRMFTSGKLAQFYEWPYQDRFLSITASPIKDKHGTVTSGVLLYQDITEQRQVKADLAEEKERLAITLRSIAEGVITTDTEDRITMMNGVAEELTGWRHEDSVGQSVSEIFWVVAQEQRNKALNLTAEMLQHGETRTGHGILISKEGEERLIYASAAPIRDAKGVINGVVIVFRDTTEERRLEREIMKARRIESMGVLAGGIAHDFNNLLTGILGNVSLARMIAGQQTTLTDRLLEAEKACLRAKELSQQLLTFAKGGTPIRKVISIIELLRETSQFALRGLNISCRLDIKDDLWRAEVDEGQISQIINNLVINASQAMPQGGEITVRAENVTLQDLNPLALSKGRYLKISVIDTGIGIPEIFFEKIFDPYFTTKQKGSGLGLASCYAIAKKHDGHITVDSKLGQGSTFSLYLPASTLEPGPFPPEKQDDTINPLPPRHAENILLMDDDIFILDLARNLFEYLGYDISLAKDGLEAVDMYQHALDTGKPFDVVIMDLTVPGGMGGREALELLRKIDPGVRAIVSSGYSTDATMSSHREHGFMGVVPKPYQAENLVDEINRVMRMERPGTEKNN